MSLPGQSCPFCGCVPQNNPELQSNTTLDTNQAEKARALFAKAQLLEGTILALADMRISTLRQINSIRAPPNSLPYELLAYIFTLACPPIDFSKRVLSESDDDEDFFDSASDDGSDTYPKPRNRHDLSHRYLPLILSAVCSLWREVALSSPELWSTFAMETVGWKLKSQVPLLRFYLTHTGPLLFSLDLDIRLQQCVYFDRHEETAPVVEWKELQPLTDLIFLEFPEKIQTLRVTGGPPGWMCYLSGQRLPNLQDLTFAWGEDMGDPTTLTIRNDTFSLLPAELIRLNGSILTLRPSPGLPSLTTLHLRNVYIDICAKILLSCQTLIEYHCYTPPNLPHVTAATYRQSASLKEPFTLPNLKRFGWISPEGEEWNIAVLENIRLPNLEELQWCGFPEENLGTEDADAIIQFFSALPKTVHSLTYYDYMYEFFEDTADYTTIRRLLSHLPHVQSLVFRKCSGSFMRPMFRLLSDHIPGIEPNLLLPRLKRVAMCKYEDDDDCMGTALVEMLEKRRSSLHISNFTFEAMDCEVMWDRAAQDGLRELTYEFSLTILEKSQERVYAYFTDRELALFS